MRAVRFMNDTKKRITVRVNIKDQEPIVSVVPPQKEIMANMQTDYIFVKLWDNDTLLIQDREENPIPKEMIEKYDTERSKIASSLFSNIVTEQKFVTYPTAFLSDNSSSKGKE